MCNWLKISQAVASSLILVTRDGLFLVQETKIYLVEKVITQRRNSLQLHRQQMEKGGRDCVIHSTITKMLYVSETERKERSILHNKALFMSLFAVDVILLSVLYVTVVLIAI